MLVSTAFDWGHSMMSIANGTAGAAGARNGNDVPQPTRSITAAAWDVRVKRGDVPKEYLNKV